MRTRTITAIFLIAITLVAAAAPNCLGQTPVVTPVPMDPELQQAMSSVFEDRSASRTYLYDTVAPTTVLNSTNGSELVGIHGFDAVGGSDIINSISCIWGNLTDGASGRIFIWQADNSGNIKTAVPLVTQTVTIHNSNTGIYNHYMLPNPVRVTGRFFVGYSAVVTGPGPHPLVPTFTAPPSLGRAWVSGGTPGSSAAYFASIAGALDGLQFCFPLRANGTAGAFSYQGRLSDNGVNFTGATDMIFTVYDSLTGGSARSPELGKLAVPVSAGVFSVELPGDASWFADAPDAYLEIGVKPAGSDSYTVLSPRQRITPTPAALYATRAGEADSAPWSGITGLPANVSGAFSPWSAGANGISYSGGRVGVGTATPGSPLHLSTAPVGNGWQFQLTNSASLPTYETGMRMSDGGFFEITNRINGFTKVARLDSTGAWTAASDARLKTDLTPFDGTLDAALRIRPVRFKWIGDGTADFGVIAQELRSVLPEAVIGDETRDGLTVNYSKLSVVAIGAVQEQQAQIKILLEQNEAKQREIEDLKVRLERLERASERHPVIEPRQ